SSYREISSIRNGAHCPSSGGSAIVGNSCDSVWVKSMTRISPLATACANDSRSKGIGTPSSHQFALERLRIDREALPDVLGDVTDKYVLDPLLQRANYCGGERRRRHLRRWNGLKPLGVQRPEEYVHHLDPAGA